MRPEGISLFVDPDFIITIKKARQMCAGQITAKRHRLWPEAGSPTLSPLFDCNNFWLPQLINHTLRCYTIITPGYHFKTIRRTQNVPGSITTVVSIRNE
jgi:hypothetical protein